ncbi:MAG: tetratricopeptide repeat protein [Elusimicrobiota bacterium]
MIFRTSKINNIVVLCLFFAQSCSVYCCAKHDGVYSLAAGSYFKEGNLSVRDLRLFNRILVSKNISSSDRNKFFDSIVEVDPGIKEIVDKSGLNDQIDLLQEISEEEIHSILSGLRNKYNDLKKEFVRTVIECSGSEDLMFGIAYNTDKKKIENVLEEIRIQQSLVYESIMDILILNKYGFDNYISILDSELHKVDYENSDIADYDKKGLMVYMFATNSPTHHEEIIKELIKFGRLPVCNDKRRKTIIGLLKEIMNSNKAKFRVQKKVVEGVGKLSQYVGADDLKEIDSIISFLIDIIITNQDNIVRGVALGAAAKVASRNIGWEKREEILKVIIASFKENIDATRKGAVSALIEIASNIGKDRERYLRFLSGYMCHGNYYIRQWSVNTIGKIGIEEAGIELKNEIIEAFIEGLKDEKLIVAQYSREALVEIWDDVQKIQKNKIKEYALKKSRSIIDSDVFGYNEIDKGNELIYLLSALEQDNIITKTVKERIERDFSKREDNYYASDDDELVRRDAEQGIDDLDEDETPYYLAHDIVLRLASAEKIKRNIEKLFNILKNGSEKMRIEAGRELITISLGEKVSKELKFEIETELCNAMQNDKSEWVRCYITSSITILNLTPKVLASLIDRLNNDRAPRVRLAAEENTRESFRVLLDLMNRYYNDKDEQAVKILDFIEIFSNLREHKYSFEVLDQALDLLAQIYAHEENENNKSKIKLVLYKINMQVMDIEVVNRIKTITPVFDGSQIRIEDEYYRTLNEALYLQDAGNSGQALCLFNSLIDKDAKVMKALFYRGRLLYDSGNYAEAKKDFDRAVELSPQYSKAFFYRALCYEKLGKNDLAIDDYTEIIRVVNPMFLPALERRRRLYYEEERDYKFARRDLEHIREIMPRYQDTYKRFCRLEHMDKTEGFHPRAGEIDEVYQYISQADYEDSLEITSHYSKVENMLYHIFGKNNVTRHAKEWGYEERKEEILESNYPHVKRKFLLDFFENIIRQQIQEEYHRYYRFFNNKKYSLQNIDEQISESEAHKIFGFRDDAVEEYKSRLSKRGIKQYTMHDFLVRYLGTDDLLGGYALGISDDPVHTYDTFSGMLGLNGWTAAYGHLRLTGYQDKHTDKFLNRLVSSKKPIVFFVPKKLKSSAQNGDDVTRNEMEWFADKVNNSSLDFSNLIFVYDSYEIIPAYLQQNEAILSHLIDWILPEGKDIEKLKKKINELSFEADESTKEGEFLFGVLEKVEVAGFILDDTRAPEDFKRMMKDDFVEKNVLPCFRGELSEMDVLEYVYENICDEFSDEKYVSEAHLNLVLLDVVKYLLLEEKFFMEKVNHDLLRKIVCKIEKGIKSLGNIKGIKEEFKKDYTENILKMKDYLMSALYIESADIFESILSEFKVSLVKQVSHLRDKMVKDIEFLGEVVMPFCRTGILKNVFDDKDDVEIKGGELLKLRSVMQAV